MILLWKIKMFIIIYHIYIYKLIREKKVGMEMLESSLGNVHSWKSLRIWVMVFNATFNNIQILEQF
jgi:hypothetical protein